jgi:hypothetical protein
VYDIVFDTPNGRRAGGFGFRFWLNDTTPPAVRVLGVRDGALLVAVTDRGSGVDPVALQARIDGSPTGVSYARGRATVSLAGFGRGRHVLRFTAADYQETKNMENVNRILPNTRVLQQAFVVP